MELTPFVRLAVLIVRPGAVVLSAPLFGGTQVPPMARIGLSVLLALVLAPVVAPPSGGADLVLLLGRELMIGVSIGLAIRIVVSAAELAGYLAGFQAGFSVAAVIDPQQGVRNNMIASLYGLMALFVFFAIDGHHTVLIALTDSYEALPIGGGAVGESLVGAVAGAMGLIFSFGLRLAAPVVFALLIVELGLGLVARAMPAMNLMVIGFPVRTLAGLIALALAAGVLPPVVRMLMPGAFELAASTASAFR